MSADGTDLKDNKCVAVTTSYGKCQDFCPDKTVKLSNGANWRCLQDDMDQDTWKDTWNGILGGNSEECSYDGADVGELCISLEKLKENVEGDARAKATGFCKEPTNSELVDWFYECDIYPYDKQLSLLEYARCIKEPDCPAEPEAANENADAQAEEAG